LFGGACGTDGGGDSVAVEDLDAACSIGSFFLRSPVTVRSSIPSQAMRARVVNGRWVLEDPTELPEGTVVEIITRSVAAAGSIYFDEKLRQYVHALLTAACTPAYGGFHSSPPPVMEQELVDTAKACASQSKRSYVTPQDVKQAAPGVLRRMVPKPESVQAILDNTPMP
jgi:hypothetical protein